MPDLLPLILYPRRPRRILRVARIVVAANLIKLHIAVWATLDKGSRVIPTLPHEFQAIRRVSYDSIHAIGVHASHHF
jgi:hypothetical protein